MICFEKWEQRQGPASVNRLSATSCNSHLLLINRWSQQAQKNMHRRERQIHADNITTLQPPSQVSTSSVRTQPLSYRGPNVPWDTGDKLQDTTHSTWRCRTDIPLIPHLRIPAQEPWRQRTLLECGEFWALSYTWALPPSSFLIHFCDTSEWHIEAGQSLHLQPPNGDWYQRRYSIHPNRR